MDVTSLLNSGSGAMAEKKISIDQAHIPSVVDDTTPSTTTLFPTPSPERTLSRRGSESRARIGGRTPWDAGGYSLPLSLDTKNLHTSMTPSFYLGDYPIETTSSASPNSPKHKCSDSQSSLSSYTSSVNSVSHSRISSLSTVSEFQPLSNILADMASDKISEPILGVSYAPTTIEVSPPSPVLEESPSRMGDDDDEGSQLGSDYGSFSTLQRPRSPSDAIMISRFSGEERRGSQDSIGTILKTPTNSLLSPEQVQTKSHKRAASAPDISVLGAGPDFDAVGEQDKANMPSNEDQPANMTASPVFDAVVASDTPPFTAKDKKCLFKEDCTTGSALRKAISHIFGRNKLCTRSIPEEVWVHYCRKHYQRSRYRNIKEWVVRCAEMVAKQVQHIDDWSRWNAVHDKAAGVVTGWNITIRKREQKRLQEIGKKRPLPMDDNDEFDDAIDTADLTGTAVPPWIHQHMNKTLTTKEVLRVITRLHQELKDDTATTIPDIEILPEIDTTKTARARAAPRSAPRASNNRRTGAAHKRSQSMGGQPHGYSNHHVEKRARLNAQDSGMLQPAYPPYNYASPLRQQDRFPAFSPCGGAQNAHVNGPSGQRPMGAPSMPSHHSHVENSGSFYQPVGPYDGHKVSHQRSHSEVPFSYRPAPPPQDYPLPSLTRFHPTTTGSHYYSRPQHDPSFRGNGPSLYTAPRESRPAYTQSTGYMPSSFGNTAPQPAYTYPQYPTSSAAGASTVQTHSTSMSPPSSADRPSMGSGMGPAPPPGHHGAGARHIRHQSSPAVSRIGAYQPTMGHGIPSDHNMVLPHHPAGPWTPGPSRHAEPTHYTSYSIPEAEREPHYGGPRY